MGTVPSNRPQREGPQEWAAAQLDDSAFPKSAALRAAVQPRLLKVETGGGKLLRRARTVVY